MYAILQYVIKLVIKPRIFRTVAKKPALTWQAVYTQIVVRSLQCYHPSMKLIGPPNTELRHVLAVYIMCPCDLDCNLFSLILGRVSRMW